ncbi:RICIN domain-containing protein [Priestia megaterium]|uniref:RICIN domain-containing protein n=1 Tax=Priestia megaterium TaxID=1404 RepID=UPI00112979E2|nr:RICIN domain-containing protein [Priestia megaterium]TPF14276.1 hypothetical protein CBE78_26185 [Priestia megaterium]TPF19563.1 hypothetical protein CBE79_26410 [Priestia megaterium]
MKFEAGKMYRFKNKMSGKYLDVARDSKDEWANIQQYEYVENALSEKFFIHPLDNNYYAIISCLSGRTLDIQYDSKDNWANVQLYHWTGADSETWSLNADPINPDYHVVMSNLSGKVLDVARDRKDNWANIQMYEETPDLDGQKWLIEEDGEVTLPTTETEELPSVPECTKINEALPDKTKKVATHTTTIPAILVQDSIYSLSDQIKKSPYYNIVKNQYWRKTADYRMAPGESHEITNTTGITETDQQTIKHTIGISIQHDMGISFGGISASSSHQFRYELEIENSHTTEKLKQETQRHKIVNIRDTDMRFVQYILETEYSLRRSNGSIVKTWSLNDKNTVHSTSYFQKGSENTNVVARISDIETISS